MENISYYHQRRKENFRKTHITHLKSEGNIITFERGIKII